MLTEDDKNKIKEIETEVIRTIPFWEKPRLISFLNFLQLLVFAFGIPFSIYTYHVNNKKEREENQFFIYDNLDKKYWDYEMMAARYPELGLSDLNATDTTLKASIKPDSLLTPQDLLLTRQMMYLLLSMYERAYLLYAEGDEEIKRRQWEGWERGLIEWTTHKKFHTAWEIENEDFDKNFQAYLNKLVAEKKFTK